MSDTIQAVCPYCGTLWEVDPESAYAPVLDPADPDPDAEVRLVCEDCLHLHLHDGCHR
ncbi:hypothetical protein [Alicyclobacillus cellulosilyticus]|nr:hypothetical protein [Alicyclobacillus cellulosilyticus]